MKLITKAIAKMLPKIGTTDGKHPSKVKVPLKLFNPTGAGTWYITEANLDTGEAFGYCMIHEGELGYVDLNELASFRGRMGLGIERDLHWDENTTLEDVIKAQCR